MYKSVGIIGFGKFGKFTAKILKNYFNVFVCDMADKKKQAEDLGVEFTSLEECASKDIVVICVPISNFENSVKKIIPYLKKKSIIADVCSVKEKPVEILGELIPKSCNCIGTHPLFGPDTASDSLKGKKIVICPIRINKLEKIVKFFENMGLQVHISKPDQHDMEMARSLALIHYLGKGLQSIEINNVKLTTPTHDKLMELVRIVRSDSEQLFLDMHKFNKYTENVRKSLIKELMKISGELDAN